MEIQLKENFFVAHKPFRGQFTLPDIGITLILGNNGVGKTSFFNHLLNHQSSYQLVANSSFVSQYRLSAVSNMKVFRIFNNIERDFPERVVCSFEKFDLVKRFEAEHLLHKDTNTLSGGENQLVKILIGFFIKAQYYFLDEPFQFLDTEKFKLIFEYMIQCRDKSLIIIDHRNPELLEYAHLIYRIENSRDEIIIKKTHHV